MIDLIFPPVCFGCESFSQGESVCNRCLEDVEFLSKRALCFRCGVPFGFYENSHESVNSVLENSIRDYLCGECLDGKFYFDKARSVAVYKGTFMDLLHKFKYERKLAIGDFLSRILIENFPDEFEVPDLVVSIPLHITKLRLREYNQSVIFGFNLARHLGVELAPFLLKKTRDTKPQFEIKGEAERRKNVKDAFVVTDSCAVEGKSVVLVDDVFTTGSTIDECSRVLVRSGASRVQVFTLMRAV